MRKLKIQTMHFGKNVIPMMLNEGKRIYVYNFNDNAFPGMSDRERGYWMDVGSIDAYWQANMDLLDYDPELNLLFSSMAIKNI